MAAGRADPLAWSRPAWSALPEALIHEHRWVEAAEVLARLKQTAWPARFNNPPDDLPAKIRVIEQEIERSR